ncbi:MAG: hypothetical protein J3K34DRAFT_460721 [Monoraphidium minutum]|nr:MAG: hypothetical protein J3K34DRAFT_460721 [Monoraphidium minutum]
MKKNSTAPMQRVVVCRVRCTRVAKVHQQQGGDSSPSTSAARGSAAAAAADGRAAALEARCAELQAALSLAEGRLREARSEGLLMRARLEVYQEGMANGYGREAKLTMRLLVAEAAVAKSAAHLSEVQAQLAGARAHEAALRTVLEVSGPNPNNAALAVELSRTKGVLRDSGVQLAASKVAEQAAREAAVAAETRAAAADARAATAEKCAAAADALAREMSDDLATEGVRQGRVSSSSEKAHLEALMLEVDGLRAFKRSLAKQAFCPMSKAAGIGPSAAAADKVLGEKDC